MKTIVCIVFLFFSNGLFACQMTDGGNENVDYSPGNIIVQRNSPVGGVITSSVLQLPTMITTVDNGDGTGCYFSSLLDYNGGVASGFADTYNTNIPGVGIKVFNATTSGARLYNYAENPAAISGYSSGGFVNSISQVTVTLVKTGDITEGSLTNSEIEVVKVNNSTGTTPVDVAYRVNLTGIANISVLACSVTSGSGLSFPIGNVPADQFTSVGTVSQQTSTQNLGLNCDAGANINVTLNGTQNPDSSDTSILALSGGANVATGVGVQLLYDGKPLQLNQMLNLKTSSGGQETFPITARYIQTKDKVTAGVANATATLNITYQ